MTATPWRRSFRQSNNSSATRSSGSIPPTWVLIRTRSRLNPVRDAMVATKMATAGAMKPVVADAELSGLACGLLSAASGRVRSLNANARRSAVGASRSFPTVPAMVSLLSELTAGAQPSPVFSNKSTGTTHARFGHCPACTRMALNPAVRPFTHNAPGTPGRAAPVIS